MFVCRVQGCDEEAKVGGMCVPHKREEIAAQRGKAEPQEKEPAEKERCACGGWLEEGYKGTCCKACREKTKYESNKARLEKKKDEAVGEKPASGPEPICGRCGRLKSQVNQPQKWSRKSGRCPNCQVTELRYKKLGKPCPPAKYAKLTDGRTVYNPAGISKAEREPERLPPPERPAGDSVVEGLIKAFHAHLDKAREIQDALTAINRLTGADFEIPEIKP